MTLAPGSHRIKVLVVEDSPTIREFLVRVLENEGQMQVVGTARNGEEALAAMTRLKPDVITMDINMPRMDGFEATRRIMQTHPTPIVIVSGTYLPHEVEKTFQAFDAGALAVLERPRGLGQDESDAAITQLVQTVRLMSEVKVIRRWPRSKTPMPAPPGVKPASAAIEVVAIGASTGGPMALKTLLSALPAEFPVPVLIVQHMAPGFIGGFVQWLSEGLLLPVQLAEQGDPLAPGRIYVAPDGAHLGLDAARRVALTIGPSEHFVCPSVSHLFRSVTAVCGPRSVGALLTGMGRDGAAELKQMKEAGGITIVQNKESSLINGMPGAALELGAATHVLPLERIAGALVQILKKT